MILEFSLVAEQSVCVGKEDACLQSSVEDCASNCANKSFMFMFGRPGEKCHGSKCNCYCQTSDLKDGTCQQISNTGYDLYRYQPDMRE